MVHEAALKAQAKKMNVDSLRSNAVSYTSSKNKLVKKRFNALVNYDIWQVQLKFESRLENLG